MKLQLARDDGEMVRRAIEEEHYLHRYPDPRSLPFSYRLIYYGFDDDEADLPWGVITFKKPQHHRQRGLFGYDGLPTAWQVLDMARVWVNPLLQVQENGHSLCIFSRMVSMALRRVGWDWLEHHPPRYPGEPYHIELILSYCDRQHHDGKEYRACSFSQYFPVGNSGKELYYRPLKPPRKAWQPTKPYQLPLFAGLPLKHGREN